jgi:hypothetical protein
MNDIITFWNELSDLTKTHVAIGCLIVGFLLTLLIIRDYDKIRR